MRKEDIDQELEKIQSLKTSVEKAEFLISNNPNFVHMSMDKYEKLSDRIKKSGLTFYILEPEIFYYLNEDSVIEENNKVFVFRNGECVYSMDLELEDDKDNNKSKTNSIVDKFRKFIRREK